jgi:hypothetical protein
MPVHGDAKRAAAMANATTEIKPLAEESIIIRERCAPDMGILARRG